MLDIKFIRANVDRVKAAVRNKNKDVDIDRLLALDDERRTLQQDVESLRAEQKAASTAIAAADADARAQKIAAMTQLKATLKEKSAHLARVREEYEALLYTVPNVTDPAMPVGKDESDNVVLRTWGRKPQFDFTPRTHDVIATAKGWLDTEKAAAVSGARFWYLKGDLVFLQWALHQFALRTLTDEATIARVARDAGLDGISTKPFEPVLPPVMVRRDVQHAIHRIQGDTTYRIEQEDLNLVASAEHTLAPYHMDEILDAADLPKRYIGFSSAFRREAGTYGKDMKGFFRGHQFDKSEMESFTTAEDGAREQQLIVALQEYMVQQLGLHYRVVQICTGDTGAPDYQQYDIETWLPGQDAYRETHTSDYMTDYQTRGINARYRDADGATHFLHTNDATAFAGRTLIAILEQYQNADGTVRVPDVLQPLMPRQQEVLGIA